MLKELLKSGTKVSTYVAALCMHVILDTMQALDPLIKYFTAKLTDLQSKLMVPVLQR